MKCSSAACLQDAVWRAAEIRNRAMQRCEQAFCESHARLLWESYLSEDREGSGQTYELSAAACFELELVMADYKYERGKVLLREVRGRRMAFFPIGYVEVCVLWYAVQDSSYKERSLHIALNRLIEHFGGTLLYVVVDHFNPAGYFEATAGILHNQVVVRLRIRPSDGLALAILAKVPFLITEEVLATIPADFGKL